MVKYVAFYVVLTDFSVLSYINAVNSASSPSTSHLRGLSAYLSAYLIFYDLQV